MVIRNIAPLVLILLLIGTASPQGTGELGGFMTGSGLTGQVVDLSGRGISGAKVWIIGGEGQAINTSTNATGHYGPNLPLVKEGRIKRTLGKDGDIVSLSVIGR